MPLPHLRLKPVLFSWCGCLLGWFSQHLRGWVGAERIVGPRFGEDVAVTGARPAWFQTTIIVPVGTGSAVVRDIFRDIYRSARQLGIALTGGHTEVSPAVRQPIVAGDTQGLVSRGALVTSAGARAGDAVILTKAAAIEGTSIIARRFPGGARDVLGKRGQQIAARFHHRPGISVVAAALLAARHGASAMHDPTEGGVAAGLFELAAAARVRVCIDIDEVPVLPQTEKLCSYFGLRPLGLIGPGALLLTIASAQVDSLLRALRRRDIPAACSGTVARGRGVEARSGGKRCRFVWSARDELTKLFAP